MLFIQFIFIFFYCLLYCSIFKNIFPQRPSAWRLLEGRCAEKWFQKSKNNAKKNEGWGAFEIAARYSSIDLSDSQDGKLNDITLGLNWYLNPCTRFMINYVLANYVDYEENETTENIFQLRMQIDF